MSNPRRFVWQGHIPRAVEVLSQCASAAEAAEILSDELKHPITRKGLLSALKRAKEFGEIPTGAEGIVGTCRQPGSGLTAPLTPKRRNNPWGFASAQAPAPVSTAASSFSAAENIAAAAPVDDHAAIVRAVQKGARTIAQLADVLDCSPKRAQHQVDAAIAAGHTIVLDAAGGLAFELPPTEVQAVRNVPRDGDWTMLAVMSDLHVGSKHCLEEEITRFAEFAYGEGFRHILIPGDLCEGDLRHHGFKHEVRYHGFDEQVDNLLRILPVLPGLEYRCCVGNHEINSYWKTIGMRPDLAIQIKAHEAGRHDFFATGAMTKAMESAYLLVNPGDPETEIKVELSHTDDKKTYAISYSLQKHVEAIQPGAKPHLLLKGHLHSHSFFDLRGIVCVQAACFKSQGTWERQKRMSPQVGGILLWLKHDGIYFDCKHYWKAVRPKPQIWEPVNKY